MAVRKTSHSVAWSVAEAKVRLDDVVARAEEDGPQALARHGEGDAVVVPVDGWPTENRRKGTLAEFFHNSPLRGLEIDFERHPDTIADLREVDLPDFDD